MPPISPPLVTSIRASSFAAQRHTPIGSICSLAAHPKQCGASNPQNDPSYYSPPGIFDVVSDDDIASPNRREINRADPHPKVYGQKPNLQQRNNALRPRDRDGILPIGAIRGKDQPAPSGHAGFQQKKQSLEDGDIEVMRGPAGNQRNVPRSYQHSGSYF